MLFVIDVTVLFLNAVLGCQIPQFLKFSAFLNVDLIVQKRLRVEVCIINLFGVR